VFARRLCVMLGICCVLAPTGAFSRDFDMSQIYTIEAAHSYVGFQIKYMGFAKVRGRFSDFSGTVRFDEADPTLTSVTARIAVASIDTEHNWRDKDLKSDQWFDAEKFPAITFQSTRAVKTDAGFDVIGNMTIRDVTKEVRIVMEDFSGVMKDIRDDTQVIYVGHTTIDRKAFGVKGDRWSKVKAGITGVADEVEIELTVLGKRINAGNFHNWVKNPETPQGKVYQTVSERGLDAGLEEFDTMVAAGEKVNAAVLNTVGYMLLKEGHVDDAIVTFGHNIKTFPEMGDLYDSLGEAYAVKGNRALAVKNYEIALQRNPDNVNAIEILRHLEN
jgi:polyisoprenoid-binding protein YceI